jgi:NAD(P)-dependent dehydrogenase (short-subunit alcohol dehydrogenase family)
MKTWFITGTSRGFGREWTKAALKRGDKVAATARNTDTLKDLADEYGDAILPIKLDVTNHDDDFAAVKFAFDHFGEIDIVINNAGYGLMGTIEEVSEEQARAQIETSPIFASRGMDILSKYRASADWRRGRQSGCITHPSGDLKDFLKRLRLKSLGLAYL